MAKDLKRPQRVIFHDVHLKVKDGWAFLCVWPKQSNGKQVDYRGTIYQEGIDAGVFDEQINALLRKTGKKWEVKAFDLGSTDAAWDGWWDQFKTPREIFDL